MLCFITKRMAEVSELSRWRLFENTTTQWRCSVSKCELFGDMHRKLVYINHSAFVFAIQEIPQIMWTAGKD